jgi:MFS family permease
MSRARGALHDAWIVLGAVMIIMLLASGLRAVFGVFIKPIEATFGWDRASLSGVAALSLLLLGAVGPVAGWLADRWGPRRVIVFGCLILAAGTVLSSQVMSLWQIYLSAGVLMAVGGGGIQMSTAATVAARWFEARRGLVLGILGGAMSAGQLVIIPLAVWLTLHHGWRQSFLWLGIALLIIALPLALWFVKDDPARYGLQPYGAGQSRPEGGQHPKTPERRVPIGEAMQVPAFWLLASTFFVCGYTTGGLVLTHLVPHAADHGFSEMNAAQAMGVMGALNILGTVASGWICDHFGRKGPLAFYYAVRGLSLLFLLYVWNVPSLNLFAAIFGLNYISTVPATTTLTANIFGRYSIGTLSGWIYFAHQVGAALGAAVGGWMFQATGSYGWAFVSGAVLAFVAAALALAIKEEPLQKTPRPAPMSVPVTVSS